MTCLPALAWLVISGLLAAGTGVVLAWGRRDTTQLLARMDTAHRAAQATAQAILDRMDREAEHRAAALKALRGGEEGHRC
jgi:hypothetical protein